MEYYDSIGNSALYTYYSQKNLNFLINSEVNLELDKSNGNDNINGKANRKVHILNNETPYKLVQLPNGRETKHNLPIYKQNTLISFSGDAGNAYLENYEKYVQKEMLMMTNNNSRKNSKESEKYMTQIKKISSSTLYSCSKYGKRKKNEEDVKKEMIFILEKLNSNLASIKMLVDKDINEQKKVFEEKKLNKLKHIKGSKKRQSIVVPNATRRGSKIDEILIAAGNLNIFLFTFFNKFLMRGEVHKFRKVKL
jgi:hypothetical protein